MKLVSVSVSVRALSRVSLHVLRLQVAPMIDVKISCRDTRGWRLALGMLRLILITFHVLQAAFCVFFVGFV